ncbi:MAG: hypothetical protein LAO76_09870 [Acidobacteriia bacterium]|nr:hypothetical protein [Terriglobia bacterium]
MKASAIALLVVLLAPNIFCQSPSPSAGNRIVGARLDAHYNEDRTSATVKVTNISTKEIATVRLSYSYEGASRGKSVSNGALKPGEILTESISGAKLTAIDLDAITYGDGSQETRNDEVTTELKDEAKQANDRRLKEMEYARAFAVVDASLHMSQEEQIIRKYYSKLGFLQQISVLLNVIMRHAPALTEAKALELLDGGARFTLSDFQVGNFSEIEGQPWTWLLNLDAPQDVIDVHSGGGNIGINDQHFFLSWYEPTWNQAHASREQQANRREQTTQSARITGVTTVKDLVMVAHPGEWSRYGAFTVHAMLEGHEINYRATFVFGQHGTRLAIFDPAMHVPVEINAPLYPSVFVESVYRELPLIREWVNAHQLSGCKKLQEPETCCDPATGQCGLASEDAAHSLNLPINDKDRRVLKGLMYLGPIAREQRDDTHPTLAPSNAERK